MLLNHFHLLYLQLMNQGRGLEKMMSEEQAHVLRMPHRAATEEEFAAWQANNQQTRSHHANGAAVQTSHQTNGTTEPYFW
mmetsp:Transcript_6430/g.9044  ORF Transcript_6430/g.9044 Transcript_6430/m.9044 type:complete len:80 (+) Transcript_6430:347-586(+)